MKILFVAFPESIHTARWINQMNSDKVDVHLIPSSQYYDVHEKLHDITVHKFKFGLGDIKLRKNVQGFKRLYYSAGNYSKNVINELINISKVVSEPFRQRFRKAGSEDERNKKKEEKEIRKLVRLIKKIKPDVIHSLETQHSGYLVYEAKKRLQDNFPVWIHTNWGADLHLFGRIAEHKEKIKNVLSSCDYYSCECHRDIEIAEKLGLKAKVLPVFPNTGGFDFDEINKLSSGVQPSKRKKIMLKGYQGWAGRSLAGIRALERCADILQGYEILIYLGLGCPEVVLAAELLSNNTGIPVKMVPYTSHEEILKLHGQSRISIGLSITDAISTSMLEAMVMGSFPVQSNTACAEEWVENGRTALMVPPEDPDIIEQAIRKALADDKLVDKAAELNLATTKEKLDNNDIKEKVKEFYEIAFGEQGI